MKAGETEFLYLTTAGRRSGQRRQIEIWFTQQDGRYYVIAEHLWEAQWVQNISADPRVTVRVAGEEFQGHARVIEADTELELHRKVQELSEKKYGWGDGLVIEVVPDRRGDTD